MNTPDIIRMSVKEAKRLPIIDQIIGKQIKQSEGARLLGLSTRQIRRLTRRVREEGPEGITHRSRGRQSNRRISLEIKERAIALCVGVYAGFGPTLASEKLLERDGIRVNSETLRLWLNEAGISYKKRKKRPHRQWRKRRSFCGELIQIDGSHHDWLEGRGAKLVLMGYIDDATGRVFCRFYDYEGTIPAFDSFQRYAKKYGLPLGVYLDQHSTYRFNGKPTIEDELRNRRPQSQFERGMAELGVEVIHANSPQAKGRVERLFRTFQDRLVKEMRLEKIGTRAEANRFLSRYLPKYNRKFCVPAAQKADAHRRVPKGTDLGSILSIHHQRVIRKDGTVMFEGGLYQLKNAGRLGKVTVERRINGRLVFRVRDRVLSWEKITTRPPGGRVVSLSSKSKKTPSSPQSTPWRQFSTRFYSRQTIEKLKKELVTD